MHVEIFQYDLKAGKWSLDRLPGLDSEQTLVLGFGATEIQSRPEVFQVLRSYYPSSHVMGCSTAGEFLNEGLRDDTMSVAVARFTQTRLASTSVVVRRAEQSEDAGRELGRRLPRPGLSAILLLTEGLGLNHRALLDGMHVELGFGIPLVGTLASDGHRFERTWVWQGERIQSGLCAAVGFYGPSVIVQSGQTDEWKALTHSDHRITKVRENVVLEIDGRPALEVCRTQSRGLRALRPVGETGPDSAAFFLGVDEEKKAVVLSRPLKEGTAVQLLPGDPDGLLDGAASAANELRSAVTTITADGGGVLALATSSIGRRLMLGSQAAREPRAISASLPSVPLIGLYTYGDLSSDSRTGVRDSGLRVTLLSEESAPAHAAISSPELGSSSGVSQSPTPSQRSSVFTEATSSTLSGARPYERELGAATATVYHLENMRFIALQGTLNESFEGGKLASEILGRVVLDLAGVEHITSFGVRGWLDMMGACESQVSALYLANLSEAVVNQMLMVRNFAGKGQIVSFGAPYICTACSNSFEFLLDCEHSAEEIREASPPDVACSECGNRAVFDDDPSSYFEFVLADLDRQLPADVRNALAERRLEWMSHVEESIEKRVEGDRTVFRIDRKVDEKIRWQRVLSGVEGTVRLDFTRSKGSNPVGADRLLTALRLSSDSVTSILFDQVPLAIVEQMVGGEAIPTLRVRTIAVPARCANCGVVRQASIDPAGIREAKRQGLQPESECRRCSGSIPISLPPEVSAFFEGGASPSRPALPGAPALPSKLVIMIAGAVLATVAIVVLVMALL
jgi:hypothetical protein